MNFSKEIRFIVFAFLALVPMFYLFFFTDSLFFSNFSNSMRSIGRILGLAGMILFSLTFLLNARLKFTEKLFGGLDQTYKAHHTLGTIAFLLLLFHPLFLASQFIAISTAAAAKFLFSFNTIPITFGSIALFSMEIFLILTFFSKLKYQNWKFTHRLLGISFILASLHVLLIPSDVSKYIFLRLYMAFFIIVGIASFSYRTLFWKFLVRRYDYTITSIKRISDITEIKISPDSKQINFAPGQFVFISFNSQKISKEPHPFTISSSAFNKELVFSIKNLGDFTEKLKDLKKGDKVKIEGPFGMFSFVDYPSKHYTFIAGGIGVTPFLSMLRSISDKPNNYLFDSIDFVYSAKTEKEAVFLEELKKIAKNLSKEKKINIFEHFSNKQGFLTSDHLLKISKNLNESKIFICGPPVMMDSIKKQLVSSGINKNNVHMEEFAL